MTQRELKEFRRLRWRYLNTGDGKIMGSKRYKDLYLKFWESASCIGGVRRVIYVEYYHDVKSITYISMKLNYSERHVKRIKSDMLRELKMDCT